MERPLGAVEVDRVERQVRPHPVGHHVGRLAWDAKVHGEAVDLAGAGASRVQLVARVLIARRMDVGAPASFGGALLDGLHQLRFTEAVGDLDDAEMFFEWSQKVVLQPPDGGPRLGQLGPVREDRARRCESVPCIAAVQDGLGGGQGSSWR